MSATNQQNDETFKKRAGTTDVGKNYEDLLASYSILQLINNDNIQDFYISLNDSRYGIFDDIVLEVKPRNEENGKYALQLKHVNKGNLQVDALKNSSGNFSLKKYFTEFKKLSESVIKDYKLILFTNLKFQIPSDGRVISLEENQLDVKILKHEHFDEFQDGICYKFEVINETQDAEEYRKFFKQFFLYTNQANVIEIEKTVLKKFQNIFCCEKIFAEKYLNFIAKWSIQEGNKIKLNKQFMQQAIAVHLLTPLITPLSFSTIKAVENKKMSVLKDAISSFNVTIIDKTYREFVQKMWSNLENESEEVEKLMLKKGRQFQVISDGPKNNTDKTKLFWLIGKCPLIVIDNETSQRVINVCQNCRFIILEEEDCRKNLQNAMVFQNLADFEANSSHYKDILETFKCSLQGKPKISLKTLIGQSEELRRIITTNQLLRMLDDSLVIGGDKEILPESYINRTLTRRFVGYDFLKNLGEDALTVISCMNKFDKIVHHLEGFTIVNVKNGVLTDSLKKTIYVDDHRCSPEEFDKICKATSDKKQYYHFKIIDDNQKLECIEDKGEIIDDIHLEDKKLISCETNNNVNVIYGHSGVGKSVLMKYFKNNYTSKFWTMLINVKEHSTYFSKGDANADNFFNYLNARNGYFEQEIVKMSKQMGKITFFWDGLDEISNKNLQTALSIIINLEEKGFTQWISCSYRLLELLERNLNIFALRIRSFTDIQLITYIQNRLKETNVQEATLKYIKNSMEMVQFNDNLGVNVQIFMLTELFLRNPGKSANLLNDVFSVTNLYKCFMEKELENYYKEHYDDETHFEEWKIRQLKNYEKTAIESIFDEKTLEEMKISWEEEDEDSDFLENIDDKKPYFFHFSYLQYFAATYFQKHYKSIPHLKRILWKNHRNIDFMLDLLLAADSPPQLATLYNNLELLKKYQSQLDTCKDQLLQISSFWGDSYIEITRFLIYSGANINSANADGLTPLHLASANGHVETVRLIIHNKNTRLNPVDKYGDTPIRLAYKSENLEIIRVLLLCPGTDKNGADVNGSRLIHHACGDGNEEVVRLLLLSGGLNVNAGDKDGSAPIHLACERGHVETVKVLLLSAETNVNAADKNGARPIHLACMVGHSEIVKVLLLSRSIDVNVVDKDGSRPIHLACQTGQRDIVRMLLMCADINVDAGNKDGKTPLNLATEKGFENIMRLFQL